MSAVQASLLLEIAQYQQQLAKATASIQKFKEDAKRNSSDMGRAVLGPPEMWTMSPAHRSALRGSLAREGADSGGILGTGIMSGMGRTAGPLAIAGMLFMGIKKAGEMASSEAVMQVRAEVLIGNRDATRTFINDLKELGARTPLEFPDLQAAGQMLVAFGESAAKVPEVLRRIGDVAVGVNAPIGDIAEIYGKARVAGTLFAEDINQLTGRGIPVIQEFARILGVAEGDIKKLGSEGKITFPLLEAAFVNLTKEGGKFGGMMDRISKESEGKWSTVKDDVGAIATIIGKPVDAAKNWGLDTVLAITGGIKNVLTVNPFLPKKADAPASAPTSNEDQEAKLRAEFEAAQNVKAEEEARKASEKAAKQMESDKQRVLELQKSLNREAMLALPPAERSVEAWRQQQKVFEDMHKTGGLFYQQTEAGLEALVKARLDSKSFAAAEVALKQLKEIRDLQKIMDSGDKEAVDGAKNDAEKNDQKKADQLRLEVARQTFDLELKIAQAKGQSGGAENATIKAFQDQLNTLQLQQQIREQLKLTESESLRMAKEKVAAERSAADAAKTQKQGEAKKDLSQDLAVLRAQAAGKEELARKMQQEIEAQREAKRISEETGMSEQQALQIAREKVRLKEQIEQRGKSDGGDSRYDADGRRADGRKKINAKIEGNAADRQDHLYGAGNRFRNNQAQQPGQSGLGPRAERNAQKDTPQAPDSSNAQLGQQILQAVQQMLGFMQ